MLKGAIPRPYDFEPSICALETGVLTRKLSNAANSLVEPRVSLRVAPSKPDSPHLLKRRPQAPGEVLVTNPSEEDSECCKLLSLHRVFLAPKPHRAVRH